MDIPSFFIQILNSIQYGLLLFLCASGLTLVFGIMGVINLAHGSLYMIGAYLAFSLSEHLGSLWLALPVGVVLAVVFGAVLEWLLIERLYKREHLHQVLLTYGLILVFEELRSVIWGDDVHGVAMPPLLAAWAAPAFSSPWRSRAQPAYSRAPPWATLWCSPTLAAPRQSCACCPRPRS